MASTRCCLDLFEAVFSDCFECVKIHGDKSDFYDYTGYNGDTALHLASGKPLILEYLLPRMSSYVNVKDNLGKTPLFYTFSCSEDECLTSVKLLKNHNADVHLSSSDGKNLLFYAAMMGYLSVFKYLLSLGVNPKRDNDNMTILHECLLSDSKSNLDSGLESDSKSNSGLNSNNKLFKFILENAPILNIDQENDVSDDGMTTLHFACYSKNFSALKCLSPTSIYKNINKKNNYGQTPLIIYLDNARGGPINLEFIKYLLKNGANPHIQRDGSSSLDLAFELGDPEIIKTIQEHQDLPS